MWCERLLTIIFAHSHWPITSTLSPAKKISPAVARKLALLSQGLHKQNALGKGKPATLRAIQNLGYVQIDTISVVERAHHHVLQTRVNGYQPKHLDELQREKRVFEYWSHAAAYLPIEDFRYSLPRKHAIAGGEKHWYEVDPKLKQSVLERVRQEGPLKARDFEHVKRGDNGWWEWKPAKRALEQLFMEGALMIVAREGFQKVFDLTERALPSSIDTRFPSQEEYCDHLIHRYLGAHGIGTATQMGYLRKGLKSKLLNRCDELVEEGLLVDIDLSNNRYFASANFEQQLGQSLSQKRVEILSPFDNLVIQRDRAHQIFGFDYLIECYVPEPKRKFGYFVLPILWGHTFAGRMDAKVDRKTKTLTIKNLYVETKKAEEFIAALRPAIEKFAEFNGAQEWAIQKTHF